MFGAVGSQTRADLVPAKGYHDDKNSDDGEHDLVIMIMIQVMLTTMMMMMMTMHQIPFAGRSDCHTHTNTVHLSLMRQHAYEMAGWILFCSVHKNVVYINIYLGPQTTIYKWLFQLYDSKSVYRTWLFHQTSIYKWLFGVPGICKNETPYIHI